MKELYEVAVYYYVMAENREEAKNQRVDLSNCTIFAHKTKTIREDWWNSIPFGSDDDKTCGQIIKDMS